MCKLSHACGAEQAADQRARAEGEPAGGKIRGETAECAAHDGAEHAGTGRLRCFAHCEFATHPLQDLRTRGAREPVKPDELVGGFANGGVRALGERGHRTVERGIARLTASELTDQHPRRGQRAARRHLLPIDRRDCELARERGHRLLENRAVARLPGGREPGEGRGALAIKHRAHALEQRVLLHPAARERVEGEHVAHDRVRAR